MTRAAPALLLAAALLAACGGREPPQAPQAPPAAEEDLRATWRLARYALEQRQYGQAAALYDRVLARAYAGDELGTIGDVGYELAIVRLRLFEPRSAAEQAQQTRAELARRGSPAFPELLLVEAVARYELGQRDDALPLAIEAQSVAAGDRLVVARALYLQGRIAADREDRAALEGIIAQLGQPTDAELRADRLELTARRRLLDGEAAAALAPLSEAAELRRTVEDFTGMARAMALAGEASRAAGDVGGAADLMFRAGRSAQAEGNLVQAEQWLRTARRLAESSNRPDIAAESRTMLRAIETQRAGTAATR